MFRVYKQPQPARFSAFLNAVVFADDWQRQWDWQRQSAQHHDADRCQRGSIPLYRARYSRGDPVRLASPGEADLQRGCSLRQGPAKARKVLGQARSSTQSLCKAPAPESRVRYYASLAKPSSVPPHLRLAPQASNRRPRSHANPKAPVVACLHFSRQCKTQVLGLKHLLPMRTRQCRGHERRAAPRS